MAKNICILGSTGSIGTQALDVMRRLGSTRILGLSAATNIDLLESQIREFVPAVAAVADEQRAEILRQRVKDLPTEIFGGEDGLIRVATFKEADTVLTATVGSSGLKPTYEAINSGKNIALANKEALVCAGSLIMEAAKKNHISILPVDSEHSAIFQCLQGNEGNKIKRIILTASGGPFRNMNKEELSRVSAADALKHPTWNMGRKISIDSATLMNKGLELIEAKWLFGVDLDQIEVVVHPQSVVHSAVEYEDNSVIAQMGEPDMRVAIQYALTYPRRAKSPAKALDLISRNALTFEKPNTDWFACLPLAYEASYAGGSMPTVMNAANEAAVEAFLNGKIGFMDIPKLIKNTMNLHKVIYDFDIDDLVRIDKTAKDCAGALIRGEMGFGF